MHFVNRLRRIIEKTLHHSLQHERRMRFLVIFFEFHMLLNDIAVFFFVLFQYEDICGSFVSSDVNEVLMQIEKPPAECSERHDAHRTAIRIVTQRLPPRIESVRYFFALIVLQNTTTRTVRIPYPVQQRLELVQQHGVVGQHLVVVFKRVHVCVHTVALQSHRTTQMPHIHAT